MSEPQQPFGAADAALAETAALRERLARAERERDAARTALRDLLAHDFAEECQECSIGYSDAWARAKSTLATPAPGGSDGI